MYSVSVVLAISSVSASPVNATIVHGGNAKFECQAVGDPIPKIRWFIDGKEPMDKAPINFTHTDDGVTPVKSSLTVHATAKSFGGEHVISCRTDSFAPHHYSNKTLRAEGTTLSVCLV